MFTPIDRMASTSQGSQSFTFEATHLRMHDISEEIDVCYDNDNAFSTTSKIDASTYGN